jgi:hypothetical protein
MEPLNIAGTDNSPKVILDASASKFEMTGRSYPEDAQEFYEPIFNWFTEYMKTPNKETIVTVHFEYHNSATTRTMLNLFTDLKQIQEGGNIIKVLWMYDEIDEEMLDEGQDLQEMTGLDFDFQPVPED